MKDKALLYYVHDPMCSWCWGFKPVLEQLTDKLSGKVNIQYLTGGLAIDSDFIMPDKMQSQIRSTWQNIQTSIPGTEFNYDFWDKCTPKRSTYPACRAVLAARQQDDEISHTHELGMINAIQHAYYLESKNPSEYTTLYQLAENIHLDISKFKQEIHSVELQEKLITEIKFTRSIGANSFPSLYLDLNNTCYPIVLDYINVDTIIEHIQAHLAL